MTPVLAMSELDVPPLPDTAPPSGANWVAPFLLELAAALDAAPVRWMVLRNHEDLPERVGHDVDLVVHPRDAAQVDGIVRAVVRRQGAALLRAYAGTEHETFDVAAGDLSGRLVLHVDVQTAARHRGRMLVGAEDLLAHRRRAGPLWVPAPAMEAYALLLHAALHKQALRPRYLERLAALRAADRLGVQRVAAERLGAEVGQLLGGVRTEADLLELRRRLRRALSRRYPGNPARQAWFRVRHGARQARLRLWPRGVLVAFLGPDGSGKSSSTELLACRLGGYHDVLPVHRAYMGSGRPLLPSRRLVRRLRGLTGPRAADTPRGVRDVRRRKLRGALHVMADQILRFWVQVRPRLAPHGIVLVDRYAYDIFRVNNPTVSKRWFRRLAVALVPRPHLTFLLEGDPAVIAARKQELTVEETIRQQTAYRELEGLVPDFHPIDLTKRDHDTVNGAVQGILGAYARRNRGLVPWS
jgi:thymidylate kinase